MEYKIYYTKMADLDIDDIIEYIARDNQQNAIQFVSTLQEKIETTLSIFPKAVITRITPRVKRKS